MNYKKYTLPDIWEQAYKDTQSIKNVMSKGISIIGAGVKMQKFKEHIEIFNMNKGGDYFKPLDDDELDLFLESGWKVGTINLAISNCKHKLELIEKKIQNEVNTRKNDKHIQNLKNRRESIMLKYTDHKSKLNQVKSKIKTNE
ncbi:MAG TPA: hypothetical protein DCM10_15460 [Xanthomarina gelatinilytica]|nr:MAG: hypothetical protein GOVbin962_5 [Prokaryotic dsDNA virus sp.]HAI19298.1 hypothetical protein [Xanthomarina gelatinilytica]